MYWRRLKVANILKGYMMALTLRFTPIITIWPWGLSMNEVQKFHEGYDEGSRLTKDHYHNIEFVTTKITFTRAILFDHT